MSFPAQIKYLIFTLIFTIATVNFIRTTLSVVQSSKRLEDLRTEVNSLEVKKSDLEKDLEYKKTTDFIEERARDALNLVRPGEKVYVANNVLGESTSNEEYLYEEKREKQNWELWYDLLF